jgi:hypothetical protein
MSCLQTSFRDMPGTKSKLESELKQNQPDLITLILKLKMLYFHTRSFETAYFKAKNLFSNLILGLFYLSVALWDQSAPS